ncbi:MAG: hypothetical protein WC810_03020 [Janthinobacterium sp.]|jgi:hypothetical protein
MKYLDWTRGFISPRPSIFDLSIAGLLATPFIKQGLQGFYFVIYSLFLCSLTLVTKPIRNYKSIPLTLFVLWALVSIFLHNELKLVPGSIMNQYFNSMIIFEGFLYMFCGAMVIKLIITYARNLKFLYLLLPFAIIPIAKIMLLGKCMTIVLAFCVSMIVYLFMIKRRVLASIGAMAGMFMVIGNWQWLCMKWQARPAAWLCMLENIRDHPFIGNGFCKFVNGNLIWAKMNKLGWIWRHNDYLSIWDSLGIIAIISVVWFLICSFIRIGRHPSIILFITIIITCFFQMTMLFADRGVICLIIISLCLWHSEIKNKKEEIAI